jgi:hypothetical protein
MTDLERFLREMGLATPTKRVWGVWYPNGDIPH